MARPGRPRLTVTPELQRFAAEYLANGNNASRAAVAVWGEVKGKQKRHRALLAARRNGLLPDASGELMARNVVPLRGTDLVHITPPPPLPEGKSYADLTTLSNSELLQRMNFIATGSISPFARFDFIEDLPPRYETRKVKNPSTGDIEEREILVDPGRTAPASAAEEHEGKRGMWIADIDAHSFALALRAGYGVLVKSVSHDNNGRLKLELHSAAAMQLSLAKIKGLDKSASQTINIEQLVAINSRLSPEEQRARAIAAISRPLQGPDDVVDADVIERARPDAYADMATSVGAGDGPLPLATSRGEDLAKGAPAPVRDEA